MENNFDLGAWGKQSTPDKYNYQITAFDKSSTGVIIAIKAKRNDGKETVFTQKRYAELLGSGKITVTGKLTFDLAVDKDFDPTTRFVAVDLS